MSAFTLHFNELASEVHETAVEKGWWETQRSDAESIALMHSELSEALEALRKPEPLRSDKIPDHLELEEELADVIIRIMDYARHNNLAVAHAIEAKVKYNESRTYKHGGKKF